MSRNNFGLYSLAGFAGLTLGFGNDFNAAFTGAFKVALTAGLGADFAGALAGAAAVNLTTDFGVAEAGLVTGFGPLLTRLMIHFDIGCRVEETIQIKKLDEEFFD
jgi:hypothetical protein